MRRRKFISAITGAGIATVSGCSGISGGGSSDGGSGSNSSSGSGGSTETISLRVGSFAPKKSFYITKYSYPIWLEKANNKLDNYEIEPEFLGAGAVGGPGELYDLTAEGTVDMAVGLPAFQGGRMPLSLIAAVPALYPPTLEGHSSAAQALHEMATPGGESELLYSEYSNLGVRPIMAYTVPPLQMHTKTLKITDIDQLKGLRSQAGGTQSMVATELGMSPAQVAHPDIHSALQSGTIDGIVSPPAATFSNSWYDQINYCTTNLNLGGFHVGWVMSPDTLEGLPTPVREAIITAGKETVAEYASNVQQGIQDVVLASEHVVQEKPIKKGSQYLLYETDAADSINSAVKPVIQRWINSQDNVSAARKVVETYQSLQKKYR